MLKKPLTQQLTYTIAAKELKFARLKCLMLWLMLFKLPLDPIGRNSLIDQSYCKVKITEDGVTLAKAIDFSDKLTNMGPVWLNQWQIKRKMRLGME